MHGNFITVKVLINKVLFKFILINIGYKGFFIMDKNFIIKLWLPRIKILPKPITNFVKENTKEPGVEISKIVKFLLIFKGIGGIYLLIWCLYS